MKGKTWTEKVGLGLTAVAIVLVLWGSAWAIGINRILGGNVVGGDGLYLGTDGKDTIHVLVGRGLEIDNDSVRMAEDSITASLFKDGDWGDVSVATNVVTIDEDAIDKANFADEDWGDMTVATNSVTLDASVVATGEIVDQTIVKADIDTTSTFVFDKAYKVTSAQADSEYVTKGYADGLSGAPGGSDTQIQYNDGGSFGGIAGFIWDDTNIEVADDVDLAFGTDADWLIQYDETVDDQLLFITAGTAAGAVTDPMFEILVGATPTENQEVFGVAKGTQVSNTSLFTVDEDGDGIFAGGLTVANDAISDEELDEGANFTWTGTQDFTSATVNLGTDAVDAAGEIATGIVGTSEITDQTIVKDDIDTTSGFVFGSAYLVTSAQADSALVTKDYVDGQVGDYDQFVENVNLAIESNVAGNLEMLYPVTKDNYDWTVQYTSTTADQKDTISVFSFRMPMGCDGNGLDSIAFNAYTTGAAVGDASIEVMVYKRTTDGGAATAIDSLDEFNTTAAWEHKTITGFTTNAVAGDWIKVDFIVNSDNADTVWHSRIDPWYTGK